MNKARVPLMLCVVLVLVLGLIANNIAEADIIYVDLNPDVVINTLDGPGYNLNLNGVDVFNLNILSFFHVAYADGVHQYNLEGQYAGISNLIPANDNFVVGDYNYESIFTFRVGEIGFIVPILKYLAKNELINDASTFLNQAQLLQQDLGQDYGAISFYGGLFYSDGTFEGGYSYDGDFNNNRGYAGFRFVDTYGIHYGWVDLEVKDSPLELTIYGYAFETEPGVGIPAGKTPLPGSILLLGSGLLGLALRGRKRELSHGVREKVSKQRAGDTLAS